MSSEPLIVLNTSFVALISIALYSAVFVNLSSVRLEAPSCLEPSVISLTVSHPLETILDIVSFSVLCVLRAHLQVSFSLLST